MNNFIADGLDVYGFDAIGNRVLIATAESQTWAETIAERLTADPDVYVA